MENLSNDWIALMLLVFALGVKHGLDAEPLATIDGLTRFNARSNPRLARCCGFLFSLGHGAVVLVIALVGSFFALSFDTVSQAALFAVTGTRFGGVTHSVALGLLFMLGMMLMDGANGLWISRLIRRADRLACIASRVMGLAIADLSLAIAGPAASPRVSAWLGGSELAFGACFLLAVALSYALAARVRRRRPDPLRIPPPHCAWRQWVSPAIEIAMSETTTQANISANPA